VDWNLDLEEYRRRDDLGPRRDRRPPKLAHKIVFSMPAGTPPDKVLAAVQGFAREEFGLKNRYAMVLHTDEPHPHLHVLVKAVSEEGVRLNIRRETLRRWRGAFARQLRRRNVAANATERAVRGADRPHRLDGIYRAATRGESSFVRDRAVGVARELRAGGLQMGNGKSGLIETRKAVEHGWAALGQILAGDGRLELAERVRRFAENLPPPLTEREQVAVEILKQLREQRMPLQGSARAEDWDLVR